MILYATKHGATREISQRIAEKIGGAQMHDLKHEDVPDLAQFDCVIVGGSLYAGTLRKEAKAFVAKNADVLRAKKLGLFLSGLDMTNGHKAFEPNFPAEILAAAEAKASLGGIFDPKKAGVIERFIMKIVMKSSGYVSTIDDDAVSRFVEALKS